MTNKILLLLFLPFVASGQFLDIAAEICEKNQMAIVLFGDNYALAEEIQASPAAAACEVYRLDITSEFGRRIRLRQPALYLFDRNMFALKSSSADAEGWDELSRGIPVKPSPDCLLPAASGRVDPAPAPRPSPAEKQPDPEPYAKYPPGPQSGSWYVQFGVFSSGANAAKLAGLLGYCKVLTRYESGRVTYIVARDIYDTKEDAEADARRHNGIAFQK